MSKEPWHKGDGSPVKRADYMREYMRTRRADRVHVRSPNRYPSSASPYDLSRHELRDGSGIKMWPERIFGSETPTSNFDREMEAAAQRPPPAPPPPPRHKRGAQHYNGKHNRSRAY